MIRNLAKLDAFRRQLPARIAPTHSNDNRPLRRLAAPAARLACRWQVDAATGRLECHWGLEPLDATVADVPIRKSLWRPPRLSAVAAA